MERDPLKLLAQRMETLHIADAARLKTVDDEVKGQVRDAVEFAEQSPAPEPASVHEHVHA